MNKIEDILSELGVRVAEKFNLNTLEAVAAVVNSKIGIEIAAGVLEAMTIDEMSRRLFDEISMAR